jgi:hypothetical protein
MSINDLQNIEVGTKFRYISYSSVEFIGTDSEHVILKDNLGNVRKIHKVLFVNYAKAL